LSEDTIVERQPLPHLRLELDHGAIHHELAEAAVMDGFRIFLLRVDPGLHHLEHEQVVFVDEATIGHPAFKIGKTLGDQGRTHARGLARRQAEFFELRNVAARAISDVDDFLCKLPRRNGDDAFSGRRQRRKTVIVAADDASDQRRLELNHHETGHGHDIGAALV
jgi:hypothetical protein